MKQATLQDCIKTFSKPVKQPRYFKRFRQWWAMLMLRRDLAKRGVHVWKYSDDELKEQCREGLKACVELIEQYELERLYRLGDR